MDVEQQLRVHGYTVVAHYITKAGLLCTLINLLTLETEDANML